MAKVVRGVNDLKTLYPDLCKEWHPTKNGELKPENMSIKSHRKVWWQCARGHEWEAMVSNRTGLGRNCPYCAGRRPIIGETDLASANPEVANEWHPTKNAPLTPKDVTFGSSKKIWWQCANGHEWQAIIKSRTYYNTGCPYCCEVTKIVTKGVNDFESRYPELAKEWHPTKNLPLKPDSVSYGSGKKVWWICKFGHEYQMVIGNKVKGRGCTVCSRRRRTSFPEQAFFFYIKQAYPDAINGFKDKGVFGSGMELDIYIPSIKVGIEYDGKVFHSRKENLIRDAKKFQKCEKNGIRLIRIVDLFDSSLLIRYHRVIRIANESPKYLQSAIIELLYHLNKLSEVDVDLKRDRNQILEYLEAMDKSLETEFPDIAKEFHPTKNGNLTAAHFHYGANERVWWKCSKCGHEWQAMISDRTGKDRNGCPKCSKIIGGRKRHETALKESGSLASNFPELLNFWSYSKNTISPAEVTPKSGTKVWWVCEKGHEWDATVGHITTRGAKCPYCSNKRILVGYNDLATINPKLAREWDYTKNGELTPNNIGAGSGKKAWWICSKCGNSWVAAIHIRNKGRSCPKCSLKRRKSSASDTFAE